MSTRLSDLPQSDPTPGGPTRTQIPVLSQWRRRRAARKAADAQITERSIVSALDRKSPVVRMVIYGVGTIIVLALIVVSVGPIAWLFKAATSTSTEILADPFGLWPSGMHWDNFTEAFRRVRFGTYLQNTLWIVLGNWVVGIIVQTTGAYALAILKPRYSSVIYAMVLATLFIPGVISLVALYMTVVNVPIVNISLMNTFWAVWLPAGASAFNVVLLHRSFSSLPRELFDAARIDGAGETRIFLSIVLPMSRPILGVISLFIMVNAYKDFLWPLLVLTDTNLQPLSVALPRLESATELSVYMAALFLTIVIPVALFLAFQKQFLSAAGSSGALKE